jgi:hypothetical protein
MRRSRRGSATTRASFTIRGRTKGPLSGTTRQRLIGALEMLADKRDVNPRKKHGNIPL